MIVAAAGVACSLLDAPSQCATDGDCARFNARCDVVQAVCVPSSSADDVSSGAGGSGTRADPPLPPECSVAPKPTANPSATLTAGADGGADVVQSLTLGCDKDWILEGPLVIRSGATLTIAAGTTIRAKKATGAAIIVQRGGRIVADGQRNAPIVMTVDDPAPKPGDWRGLFVLGNAPRTGTAAYQGDPLLAFGGTDAEADSGVLSFVRVEYAKEALVLAGLGRKTKIDSVQVRFTTDNCYALAGGTVDGKHLVCQQPADDHFELGDGYRGRLQFLFGQGVASGDGHHGLLVDGDQTAPVLYNVTLCARTPATNGQSYGIVFRNNASFDANNTVITGWFGGLDATGTVKASFLRGTIAFGNTRAAAPIEEDAGALLNDDDGFDELAFFRDGGNAEQNPNLVDCYSPTAPQPWTATALTTGARTPPAEFFDATAKYIGAFRDATDPWMTGTWARFDVQ